MATYSNCTVGVIDAAGNLSTLLTINTLRRYTRRYSRSTSVTTPTNNLYPSYTFSSTEAGAIT